MSGRVVVAGGSGLIGRRLVAELAAAGFEVVVLSRRPAARGLPSGVRVAGWDGVSAAGWESAAEGARALVNLAGEGVADGRWTAGRKRAILDSRLRSTAAMIAAIERAADRPAVLLQGSAVGFYGPRGDEVVDESTPAGNDFLAQVTTAWEAASAPAEALGVRRVLLRTGVVLDPRGGALPKMALPVRLFVGGPLGSGRQVIPWIHHHDEVAAIRFLLEHPEARGAFNLTAPTPVAQAGLAKALGRALHRPAILPTPAFALRLAVGEMAEVLLTGQRAMPRRLVELGFRFRYSDLDEALADLFS